MHMDPVLPIAVGVMFCLLFVGLVLRKIKQPHVVAYLLAGVAIGPHGLDLIPDGETLARLGEFGVILLLFFVGMEVSVPRLLAGWKVAILGTLLQIGLSVLCAFGLGTWLDWPVARSVLFGFAISLSGTAVAISLLRNWDLMDTEAAQDALGILLVQDVTVIPMLIVMSMLAGPGEANGVSAVSQITCGLAVIAVFVFLGRGGRIPLPLGETLRRDNELQVFTAFLLCFGLAWITAAAGLSTALGAFVAGLIVGSARETDWVSRSLEPMRVVFLAMFFASIGLLLDLHFIREHWVVVLALVAAALLTNTLINAVLLRGLGRRWSTALFVGALLSPIGEFSFVLAAVGRQSNVISDYAYQGVLAIMALTLAVSPLWVAAFGRFRPNRLTPAQGPRGGGPRVPPSRRKARA